MQHRGRICTSPGRSRLNFLNIARASLAEVGYCIHVTHRLAYVTADDASRLEIEIKQVGAPLAGLIRSEQLIKGAEIVRAVLVFAFVAMQQV